MFVWSASRQLSRTRPRFCAFTRPQSAAQPLIEDFRSFFPVSDPDNYNAIAIAMDKKRKYDYDKLRKPKPRKAPKSSAFLPEGSNEEILDIEVAELLSKTTLNNFNSCLENGHDEPKTAISYPSPYAKLNKPSELGKEVELDIIQLSSTGDGLAYNAAKDHVFIVPFSIPGDRVLAKPWKWEGRHTQADFIKLIKPSASREGVRPPCQYFAKCSGCQFQMLPYEKQLEHKRSIVQRAFDKFSGLKPEQMPEIEPTMGSPLQYGYRTKLTPHFSGPKTFQRKSEIVEWKETPNIGFNVKGSRNVMDIESCPIGTDIVQAGLKIERARVQSNLSSYKMGATILLRESTERKYNPETKNLANGPPIPTDTTQQPLLSTSMTSDPTTEAPSITLTYSTHTDTKTYVSDNSGLATEYITTRTTSPSCITPKTKTYAFTNTAGSFFQNNNSILGPFTSYIYQACVPVATDSKSSNSTPSSQRPKYLLDAYSGSGLFTLTLSSHFTSSLGIDIDMRSIAAARENATRNNITNAGFIDADASALFADVPYPPEETVVVVDPPRKGCDREFLKQLRRFGARRVVYVSCNVHSQARDVGVLVNGFRKRRVEDGAGRSVGWYGAAVDEGVVDEQWEEQGLWKYDIESVRGFDFFPQTGHVEGVCVLNRVG